ncbi:MAG: plasmid pRiA4b ORF-3 family protein, partial [Clostridia bacterium]|nr:plasmid pRiA4b ORF-3 family protein [Clostridia bacterium]
MIRLFSTKKTAELLPSGTAKYEGELRPLEKWCVHITDINGRRTLVVMCADNRFAFVVWGVRKPELKNIPRLVSNGLKTVFMRYGIREEITADLSDVDPVIYTGMDRGDVGRMNRLSQDLTQLLYPGNDEGRIPIRIIKMINNCPVGVITDDPYFPRDRMLSQLEEKYGRTPVSLEAFEIEAVMDLAVYKARRKLIVPLDSTFRDLHVMLQIAFGWSDYHLYEFKAGKTCIMENDEMIGIREPALEPSEHALSELLQKGTKIKYYYDFGDGWEIDLKVRSVIEDHDKAYPVCTSADGAAPPEDVGGVYGYADFLNAYNDPENPEHDEVHEWADGFWDYEADSDRIS